MVAAGRLQMDDLRQRQNVRELNFRHGEVSAKEAGFIRECWFASLRISGEQQAKTGYGRPRQDFDLMI
jgi:hypothetical protein